MQRVVVAFTLLLTRPVVAQSPYRPFPLEQAGWVEEHGRIIDASGMGFTYATCYETVLAMGDTSIGAATYARLGMHGHCHVEPEPPTSNPSDYYEYDEPWSDLAYVRQDTTERKVYLYDPTTSGEVLLYDFVIGIGPYPVTYMNSSPGNVQVVALDSVALNDGWHRSWVLSSDIYGPTDSAFCTVIEGVGSTLGVLSELIPRFENYDELICNAAHGSSVFPFGDAPCDLTLGAAVQPEFRPVLSLSSNPATDAITVTGDLPPGCSYELRDMLGRILLHGVLDTRSIALSPLPAAAYLLLVRSPQGQAWPPLRVVKQ